MRSIIKFLKDLCLLVYLLIKSIIRTFIPDHLIGKDLRNEAVLVTGGAGGLGRLLSTKLSALGCRVVIWDMNRDGGHQTVKLIREQGGVGCYYMCDVANRKDVYATALKVKNEVGNISILINNAGVVTAKPFLECSDEAIEGTVRVNAISHFWTCKAFLPDMISSNYGHIVTVASLAGYFPLCGLTDYCASKHAAVTFHECLNVELKRENYTGINTTLVCPFHINTGLFKGLDVRLLPTIEAEYVADKIISSIRRNEEVVVIPGYFRIFQALKSLFPLSATIKALEMLNGFNAMDGVKGQDIQKKQAAY